MPDATVPPEVTMIDVGMGFDWVGPFVILSFAVPLIITGLVIGLIVWSIRRSTSREDPAVAELKSRYARGEIDPAEFEVRMRSLTQDRD